MFTGLVGGTGRIESLRQSSGGTRLRVDAGRIADGLQEGDSVAVNGCCLTVVAHEGNRLGFDVLTETLRRTNLGDLRQGGLVNLERAMASNWSRKIGSAGYADFARIRTIGKAIRREPGRARFSGTTSVPTSALYLPFSVS